MKKILSIVSLVSFNKKLNLARYSLVDKTEANVDYFKESDLPYISDNEIVNIQNELQVRLEKENRLDKLSFYQSKIRQTSSLKVKKYCSIQIKKIKYNQSKI
jgi:hypothetical protein